MARAPLGAAQSQDPRKVIGLGAGPGMSPADVVKLFKSATDCPELAAMPTVAKIQWEFEGPISADGIEETFGAEIDILGSGKNPDGIDVVYQTPGLINGEFQTFILACAVGVHLEPEPFEFTARGNAIPAPANAQVKPISPDAWTRNDLVNGALGVPGTLPPVTPQQMFKARLEWGWWINHAFWSLVRAYNVRWTYGSLVNVMDQQLRDVAYTPPNAQDGSAGDYEVDLLRCALQTNNFYTSTEIGANLIFLMIDAIRVGSIGIDGVGAGNLGIFRPSDDFQFMPTQSGGVDLRSMLGGNSEFYALTLPYMLQPGVPPGLIFEEKNTPEANSMRQYLSVTDGFAGTPPGTYTEFGNLTKGFSGTGITPVGLERTADQLNVPQQYPVDEAIFKGGHGFMSIEIKGFEIGKSLASQIESDINLQAQLCSECGFAVGWQ
jgi:hypothetical protein